MSDEEFCLMMKIVGFVGISACVAEGTVRLGNPFCDQMGIQRSLFIKMAVK